MRRTWAALALLAGCAAPPPEVVPPSPEDRARLQERVRSALEAPFVLARFYAEHEVDGRVRISCRGIARGFRSGVVWIEEESLSGSTRRLLRVGDRAWVYEDGWRAAGEKGLDGLGTGFQNPQEVLLVLEAAAERFVPSRQGGLACPGLKDMGFLRPLTDRSDARPPVEAPIEGVLKTGFREGPLTTRFGVTDAARSVWIAKVDIESWGPAPPMSFDDIPAPFTPDMKAAVRKALEGAPKK